MHPRTIQYLRNVKNFQIMIKILFYMYDEKSYKRGRHFRLSLPSFFQAERRLK
jgi:hypothetical protein